ncbi:hypothetical protein MMC08_009161, partial [Hypocenomyce scalaris]|nr:hypothetical protein [Hypocenomyce scalaris]
MDHLLTRFSYSFNNSLFKNDNSTNIAGHRAARARATVSALFKFITLQGDRDYIGEMVSQLEHSLQAAHLAQQAGADEETILGALLHDVGRFIPAAEEMPKMIAPNGTFVGCMSHELLGEKYLRQLG